MFNLLFINTLLIFSISFSQTCIGGKWDITSNIWFRDCTTYDQYDGRYIDGSLGRAYSATTVTGDTVITLADNSTQTIYWRLYWYNNIPDNTLPVPDSIPLMAGVHCWTDYTTLDQLFESGNTYLGNAPAAMRVISLTFSINISGNNSGTWWWGSNISGVPTPWAEEAVIRIIRQRTTDACQLLANAGNTELNGKQVDVNRVYLRGHSMGGTGAYRLGIKFPDIFAAIQCHAGFADFKGPCGAFTDGFNTKVGISGEQCHGIDGNQYVARDYTDMSWFVRDHKGVSWENMTGHVRAYEPPYVCMIHGTSDDAVNIASADRIHSVLDSLKYGCTYYRHTGEHSDANGTRTSWMLNFRKNQSYLALTNNSTNTATGFNYLDGIGWRPSSIVDQADYYEVQLTGTSGTVDITPRRLQQFIITPGKAFHYWIGTKNGEGTAVTADENSALTITGVAAGSKIIIEPDIPSGTLISKGIEHDAWLSAKPNPFNPEVTISAGALRVSLLQAAVYDLSGRRIATIPLRNGLGTWNAGNRPSGIYCVRVQAGTRNLSQRISLMR
ncbi:MAG: hypothetical protein A2268_03830 [Candidatus Raymondbacteria bacterium RifOxyA12_full_50_37]|uniref:Secretion system C-terminal sorting domain-containing protein n=1 Tax=Candidatus Raymondbacteria bacterium RIFOXYD12_FULL_49_13 TaxID=1817890 RepID=A0A1F7FBB3_UNCRA|nr:MAG: hypothetical protein A2268_03830 [Candidatus Raymondbacteria bacterium RifOxyA12_full_50_37]OGJ92200.1 MAG: hypothetical protein A2350_14885 [Candidatus Raymondbacteria bacterium RifOxyB12_full_50_8]OGJ92645.1 MAG: hypothetical protein A2248_06120 [Candidatus Raymondbacteria bacterium RIFOXYA2_FULL_49_16]OGJ97999.1 MAG: hypothetical protein A2453_03145 [Candidatus Raymondbacteria bacterium RIFOXYC2_FULL_50_21]OGJ99863.1 MAG: hypothetical protein A2487_10945 [Candidatus Raymondbacteria b